VVKVHCIVKIYIEMCNKQKFKNWWDAGARLLEIKKTSIREEIPQTFYKCPKCDYWHLTKITQNKRSVRNKRIDDENNKRHQKFIHREALFWEKKFKL
jgi:hypothetical protein